jgi:lactoylglutathione lyase
MKFGYTIAYVRDVGETVGFWERAFGLKRRFVGENNGVEIALVVEDVEVAFRSALEAGATKEAEPKTKPWGQIVAYVRDPDGVLVEIGSKM